MSKIKKDRWGGTRCGDFCYESGMFFLPHSCDEWEIGNIDELKGFLADGQKLLETLLSEPDSGGQWVSCQAPMSKPQELSEFEAKAHIIMTMDGVGNGLYRLTPRHLEEIVKLHQAEVERERQEAREDEWRSALEWMKIQFNDAYIDEIVDKRLAEQRNRLRQEQRKRLHDE